MTRYLEVQVLYKPGRGTISRTVRVSIVRWNLKEAVLIFRISLAKRSPDTVKAAILDKRAILLEVQYLLGKYGS